MNRTFPSAAAGLLAAWIWAVPAAAAEAPRYLFPSPELVLLDRINAMRAGFGLTPLAPEPRLACAARDHARDLAARDVLSHHGGDGSSLAMRLARAGYRFAQAAENLALAAEGPAQVIALWRDSRGHRRNLFDAGVGEAGIARMPESGGRRHYWVLVLGRKIDSNAGQGAPSPSLDRLFCATNGVTNR